MTTDRANPLLSYIYHLAAIQEDPRSDQELLQCFSQKQDGDAFTALMRRHGPMVWRVCWRVLGHEHDAEDVVQATFWLLACKAAKSRWHASVGNWLYGVAYHLALKAKAAAARRQAYEGRVMAQQSSADPAAELTLREFQALFDEELARLPEALRAPLVLCYLEGTTRDEAARQLNCSLATFKRQLERGRERLRLRYLLVA